MVESLTRTFSNTTGERDVGDDGVSWEGRGRGRDECGEKKLLEAAGGISDVMMRKE